MRIWAPQTEVNLVSDLPVVRKAPSTNLRISIILLFDIGKSAIDFSYELYYNVIRSLGIQYYSDTV